MNEGIKELIVKIESFGWSVTKEDDNQYFFSKFSPAGQDFSINVEAESAEDLIDNIYEAYENFDVSEATYLWLDNTGHGVKGAPHEMKDVLADMEACEQMILELHKKLI